MRLSGLTFWTGVVVVLLAAITAFDLALGDDIRLFGAYLLPVFIAGLTTTPRRTAIVGAIALAAMFTVATVVTSNVDGAELAIRTIVAIVGSGLALQTAILRERDLRTRRRVGLINVARTELEASSGLEDDLISFARAAAIEFADWAILDIRIEDGSATRTICHGRSRHVANGDSRPRENVTSAAAAYESKAAAEGPILIHDADHSLIEALFEDPDAKALRKAEILVLPISVGGLSATYFLVCPDPYPPWGAAELTQADSLARAAALAARRDQLIDQLSFAQDELRASRDQVTAIIAGIADGVTAQGVDGTMIFANDRAIEMFGYDSAEDVVGKPFNEVHPNMEIRDERGDPFDPEQMPSRRALRGEEEPEALLRYTVLKTGKEWWTLVKARAIFDDDGQPIMAISIIEDQTSRRMRELAQHVLSEAGKRIGEANGLEETVIQVVTAAVPDIADWCAIDLLKSETKMLRAGIAEAPDGLRSHDERPSPGTAFSVATTGVPELISPKPDRDIAAAIGFAHSDSDRIVYSAMIVPISDRGKPLGSLTFAQVREGTRFSEFDLETALEYGRRAGVAIASAQYAEDRARMLDTLRSSLLPKELPTYDGIELAARFRPALADVDVSGDFYDAFTLSDGSVALVIGDVCGKGPEAAAITALARYTIRTDAMSSNDPAAILRTLNQALMDQVAPDTFCTVAIVRLKQPNNGSGPSTIEVVSGGHPLPVLIDENGARAVGETGTLLGVVPDPELPVEIVDMANGAALMLYTDGLSGGHTTDDVGFALLLAKQVTPASADAVASEVDQAAVLALTRPNRDDVAILVARLAAD